MSAPVLNSYTESASFTSGTSRNISISWSAGDVIVIVGVTENNTNTLTNPPTASGLTFTNATGSPTNTISTTKHYIWSATAAAGGSAVTVTCAVSTSGKFSGIGAFVFSNSDGVGSMVTATPGLTTNPKVSLTRGFANSFIVGSLGDFAAVNDVTVTADPNDGTAVQRHAQFTTGAATLFIFNWGDQGATGTTSYGISAAGSSSQWTSTAIEVKGHTAASTAARRLAFLGVG